MKQLTLIMQGMLRLIEQKQVEDELKKTNKLHSIILNNSTVGIAFIRNRKFEWVNSRMPELFRMDMDKFQGASTRIIYPDDIGYRKVGEEIYSLLAKGKKGALEIQMKRGDGATFWCRLEGNALDPDNVHEGSIWIWEDITDRKMAEEYLKASEENYRTIFNSVNEAIFIHDADTGAILDVNKKMTDIYGFTRSEARKLGVGDISSGEPPYSSRDASRLISRTIQEGPLFFEWKAKNKNGDIFWTEVNLQSATISGVKRVIAVVRDIQKRKTAEEELSRVEKLHSVILNNSTAGIALVRNRRLEWVNPKMLEMFHRQLDEMQGASTRIIYPNEESYEREGKKTYAAFAQGKSSVSEIEAIRGNGLIFWARIEGNALDASKPQDGSIWISEDITERKLSEIRLRESEDRYKAIFENTATASVMLSIDTTILLANSEFERLSGYSKEEVEGKISWTSFVVEEDLERMIEYNKTRRTNPDSAPWKYEFRFRNREGKTLNVVNSISMVPGTTHSIASIIDITDRKKAEDSLRNSEERYRAIFENTGTASSIIGEDTIIQLVNSEWERLSGYTKDEAEGKMCWTQTVVEEDVERMIEYSRNRRLNPDSVPWTYEFRFRTKNGEIRNLMNHMSMVPGTKNRIASFIDVTERKKAEKILLESEEKYRAIFENTGTLSIIVDENTTIILANSEFIKRSGYAKEEIEGKMSWTRFVTPEDQDRVFQYADKRKRYPNDTPNSYEFKAVNRHGEKFQYMIHVGIIPGTNNRIASLIDITHIKRAENALKASEDKFLKAFRFSPAVMTISTIDKGVFIDVNEAFLKSFGFQRDEVIGKSVLDLGLYVAPEQRQEIISDLHKFGYVKGRDVLFRHKSGEVIFAIFSSTIMESGDVPYMLTQVVDITERHMAESRLKESDQRYRTFIDATSDMIFLKDNQFRYLVVNKALKDVIVKSDEEILDKTDFDLLPLDIAEQSRKTDIGALSGNSVTVSEDAVGNQYYETLKFPVDLADNRKGVGGFIRNITQRKKAEEALRKSRMELKEAQRISRLCSWEWDREKDTVTWSEEYYDIYGSDADPSPCNYKEHLKVYSPESAARLLKAAKTCLQTGETYELDLERTYKDGTSGWITTRGEAIRNNEGIIVGLRGTTIDITVRKLAEEALKEREEFLSSIIENIPHIVFIKDAKNLKYLRFNKAGAQTLGLTYDEWFEKTDRDIFPKELANSIIKLDRDILKKGKMYDILEEVIETRYGKRTVHTKKMPILDKNGNPAFILGISEDITEQLKLESQLRQSQKMEAVGRLAGGIAHDFNNMLFVITGYAEMALSKIKPDDPLRDYIDEIHRTAKRSADVTRQLLAFARSQVINPQVLDLNQALHGMLKMIKRLIGEDIELVISPEKNLWQVKIDPSQIDQILANLCINARDAISDSGRIAVETSNVILDADYCSTQSDVLPGEYVLLSVSDNGCGIDQTELPMIFEPFYTTKEHGKGTGLGLPSVYGTVKQNKGFINVISELSKGTRFEIYLPRHIPESTEIIEKNKPSIFENNTELILVVDDEPTIADMIQKLLEKLGYRVLKANTPSKAIVLAGSSQHEIDLLLTDIVMPEMNGCELADKLLSIHPEMKVLLMSGYPADEIQKHGFADYKMQFIQKPVSLDVLAAKVRETLDR